MGLKLGIEKYGVEMSINSIKSTPYVMGEKENSYSKLRTSKVMYMNERLVPMAMTLSKKITLATRYHMKKEKYASENFQVMNYGIGGRISGHLDSTGNNRRILLLLSIIYHMRPIISCVWFTFYRIFSLLFMLSYLKPLPYFC